MGQFYLNLLVLFVTLSSEIRTSVELNNEGSEVHIRKKRIINGFESSNASKTDITHVPYIVGITLDAQNRQVICGGTILSSLVMITAAHCVAMIHVYTILAGATDLRDATVHHSGQIILHPHYVYRVNNTNDLALVEVIPPFNLHPPSLSRSITLYQGQMLELWNGTLSGWGNIQAEGTDMSEHFFLRSVTVPIINQMACLQLHSWSTMISNKIICTFDAINHKRVGKGDSGGPLVHNYQLIGVIAKGAKTGRHPDLSIKVFHPDYFEWIYNTKANIEHNYYQRHRY